MLTVNIRAIDSGGFQSRSPRIPVFAGVIDLEIAAVGAVNVVIDVERTDRPHCRLGTLVTCNEVVFESAICIRRPEVIARPVEAVLALKAVVIPNHRIVIIVEIGTKNIHPVFPIPNDAIANPNVLTSGVAASSERS